MILKLMKCREFFFVILALPLMLGLTTTIIVDIFSIIALPALVTGIYYDCNDSGYGNITAITRKDELQCDIYATLLHNMFVYNITISGQPCYLFQNCLENIEACDKVMLKFNHYNVNRCHDLIKSEKDLPLSYYYEDLRLVNIILGFYCITVFVGLIIYNMFKEDKSKIANASI